MIRALVQKLTYPREQEPETKRGEYIDTSGYAFYCCGRNRQTHPKLPMFTEVECSDCVSLRSNEKELDNMLQRKAMLKGLENDLYYMQLEKRILEVMERAAQLREEIRNGVAR